MIKQKHYSAFGKVIDEIWKSKLPKDTKNILSELVQMHSNEVEDISRNLYKR
jgi:hypothetical protein